MLAVVVPVGIGLLAFLPLLGAPRALGFSLAVVGALLAGLLVEVMVVRPRVRRGQRAVLPPTMRRFLLGLASLEVALMVIAAFSRS
jgi:hypothetical protein